MRSIVFRCLIAPAFFLSWGVVPSSGQINASSNASIVAPQFRETQARPVTRVPKSGRFLGWNYARKQGPDYLKRFLRKKSDLAFPLRNPDILPKKLAAELRTTAANQSMLTPQLLPGFNFRESLPADFLPTGVAIGDFNGDGKMDWVISNGGRNSLWIYQGKGDGTASLPNIIPLAGLSPSGVTTADLRGIGILDLVVAEPDSSTIEVLLGNGDGTFAQGTLYPLPEEPTCVAVADFNGDGRLDILAGLIGNDSIAVLPGSGNGQFGFPLLSGNVPSLAGGLAAVNIAVADLNGDGHPDVVVLAPVGVPSGVFAFLNQGDGTFKESFTAPDDPTDSYYFDAIALGDLNEDGYVDLVIVDTNGTAYVANGKGDGTFPPASGWKPFGAGDTAFGAELVDVNGDGHLDLVTSGATVGVDISFGLNAGDLVSVLLGDGTGNLSVAKVYRGEPGMFSLSVADLNGDGHPDVVTANEDSDSMTVYLNDGQGGFGDPSGGYIGYLTKGVTMGGTNAPFSNFLFLDLNGDQKPDLVLLEDGDLYPDPYQITVLLNDGSGHFGPPIRSPAVNGTLEVGDFTFGDFRNTGHPDFLSVGSEFSAGVPYIVFAANAGGGTFATPTMTQPQGAQGIVATGDFNGDGNLDFVVAGVTGSANPVSQLNVFLGRGDGTFAAGPNYGFDTTSIYNFPAQIFAGDFNHDGKLDVLVWDRGTLQGSTNYDLYEFLGNGDGTFRSATIVLSNLGYFTLTDLNHDGNPDIVELVQPNPASSAASPNFNIYMGQVDGSFKLANSYSPYLNQFGSEFIFGNGGSSPGGGPLVADFNGDGNPDIAAFQVPQGTDEAIVQFLLGNGDGTFTPSFSIFHFGNRFTPQRAFDVDGDGRADLVELDGYSSAYNVLRSVPGPAIQIRMKTDPVIGATGGVVISLALAANSPTTITLSASDPAIVIPPTIVIPAGELTQEVDFQVNNTFNASHVFSIQAQLNSQVQTVYDSEASSQGALGMTTTLVGTIESAAPGGSTPDYGFLAFSTGGYASTLTISCQGLPAGATCQLGQNPLPLEAGLGANSSLIVNVPSGTSTGSYPFSVVATDGVVTVGVAATLDVGDFQLSINPQTAATTSSGSVSFEIPVQSISGYSQAVNLTCMDLPPGATCSLLGSVVAQSPPFNDPLTIQLSSVPVGTYSFTVIGTSGPLTHSVTGQFYVGDFTGSVSPLALTINTLSQANATVTLNSINSLSGQVTLSCPNPPAGIGCVFNPTISSLPANGIATGTLIVSVIFKPAAVVASKRIWQDGRGAVLKGAMATVTLLVLISIYLGVSSRRLARGILFLCLLLLPMSIGSCGGGSGGSSSGGGAATSPGGTGGGTSSGSSSSITVPVSVSATVGTESKTIGTISVTVP